MDDKILLERAAKAAGIDATQEDKDPYSPWFGQKEWNPLDDDGDALRLAVSLNMAVYIGANVLVTNIGGTKVLAEAYPVGSDPCAATRRAIVRAAAALAED